MKQNKISKSLYVSVEELSTRVLHVTGDIETNKQIL